MSMSLEQLRQEIRADEAVVSYLKDLHKYKSEKPYILGYEIPLKNEADRNNLEFEENKVAIYNARTIRNNLSVEENGFELLSVGHLEMDKYFQSPATVPNLHGAACLLKERFNTDHVFCYDHAYRKEESAMIEKEYSNVNRPTHSIVVKNPHADQTQASGKRRITQHLKPGEASEFSGSGWRIRIINFWKPVTHEIQRAPLILCDPQTIQEGQAIPCDVVQHNYVGESMFLTYDSNHRWIWFKGQKVNEAILFLSFDTHPQNNVHTCFHSSCDLINPGGVTPGKFRESIENKWWWST